MCSSFRVISILVHVFPLGPIVGAVVLVYRHFVPLFGTDFGVKTVLGAIVFLTVTHHVAAVHASVAHATLTCK